MILPNYLISKILNYLIFHEYQYEINYISLDKNYFDNNYYICEHFPASHILSYGLVCKELFEIVSSLITITSRLSFKCPRHSKFCIVQSKNITRFIEEHRPSYKTKSERDSIKSSLLKENNYGERYRTIQELLDIYPNLKELVYNINLLIFSDFNELRFWDEKFFEQFNSEFLKSTTSSNVKIKIRILLYCEPNSNIKTISTKKSILKFKNDIENSNKKVQVDLLYLKGLDSNMENQDDIFQLINNLTPKKLIIVNEKKILNGELQEIQDKNSGDGGGGGFFSHSSYLKVLQINNIKKIKIIKDFMDPFVFIGIENNIQLKSVDIGFHFHEILFHMIRLFKPVNKNNSSHLIENCKNLKKYISNSDFSFLDKDDFYCFKSICNADEEVIQPIQSIFRVSHCIKDWEEMCHSISISTTLKDLKIKEFCNKLHCQIWKSISSYSNKKSDGITDDGDDVGDRVDCCSHDKIHYRDCINGNEVMNKIPFFTDPFSLMISNNKSIETLHLEGMNGLLNETVLSSFIKNKSIKKLSLNYSLSHSNLDYFLTNVMPRNTTIKHLEIVLTDKLWCDKNTCCPNSLANFIQTNTTLSTLKCQFFDTIIDDSNDGAKKLTFESLINSSKIQKINIST
ncbi:hypothetical protein DDB_G0275003 [Dictyostelium discoideum AX4]|uniref:Putative uncharacterized protein DDB_G0275003 n=1 Tax=Dictyostelium discoideum TaxID=44689 RepID=Y5003_DICDI|nr:hypothetical protein DDB_G0275003 [Dictyostelium discoideum AX4]Q554L3.1 RecName: Full=Putative uncharacterized protein DDB_G0275003 [Dictyostelium discoideum]EAL70394.1 hypothetical protein DDB_G0275003 [Dictyostelium discoideum AX4]|eukprot:XP_644310.1 hypothetical protein DDB_G0275003 [Dictyostelium discoideum AX4]